MADQALIEDVVDKIEGYDKSVVTAISSLADRCLVDARNRTLFDVAIGSGNFEVVSMLLSDSDALEFAAPVDAQSKESIKRALAIVEVEVPISKLEADAQKALGDDLAFGRTPLLTACRSGNTDIMEALLNAGAKTNAKDVIGLTAPELAFFAHGEKGLQGFIAAFERSDQAKLPVRKRLLQEVLRFPETMAQLLDIAKPDATAKRLLFCYRCAWLDIDAVQGMLADGLDPAKGVTAELNPLWEACTSAMLWDDEIPGGLDAAYHYTKHMGHPGGTTVSFDNDLLNEDGSNFGKLFAEAERKQKSLVKVVEDMKLYPGAERDVIARRIAMLDVLIDAGADIKVAREKQHWDTFSELGEMNLGAIAAHLKQRSGGATRTPKKSKPAASTFWELVGETGLNTEYWPGEGGGGMLRLILHDVYGPVDGVLLSIQLSRGKSKPKGKWRKLSPAKETVEVDGETVPRSEVKEPLYSESPWAATYEIPLQKTDAANVLWIRLDHSEEERLSGDLDPWKFA